MISDTAISFLNSIQYNDVKNTLLENIDCSANQPAIRRILPGGLLETIPPPIQTATWLCFYKRVDEQGVIKIRMISTEGKSLFVRNVQWYNEKYVDGFYFPDYAHCLTVDFWLNIYIVFITHMSWILWIGIWYKSEYLIATLNQLLGLTVYTLPT